jgi:hypothetical protein
MPIFDRKQGKPETREILDIIFDMLTSDVPEEKILSMLKQMGISDEEAKMTLSAAKQKYEALVKSSLSAAVDKLLTKEKEELLERVDTKVDSLKKDVLLKMEMANPQLQKYVDSKLDPMSTDINSLKSDLFSTRIEFTNRLKALEQKSGQEEKKSSEILLPVILMIIGIFVMFYGASQERDLLMSFNVADMTNIFLYGIVMVMGIVFIIVGFQKYPKKEKEYAAGLEYTK